MVSTPAQSLLAASAFTLASALQQRFVARLEELSDDRFSPVAWLRDGGRHGGGVRYELGDTPTFNRGSVNVSQVHYDDLPDRRLGSATALSSIIHPRHPLAPSVHLHLSWTELRSGEASWRLMADLNPAIERPEDTQTFSDALRQVAPERYEEARNEGDRYFFIPALGRHRGASHFYLEGHTTGDAATDEAFAQTFGETVIDTYSEILARILPAAAPPTEEQRQAQLAYHTLYLFQVLTLDRGTTTGLLVHDQNDVGILGSLPATVDLALLTAWVEKVPDPQASLVLAIIDALGGAAVTKDAKLRLAAALRTHYDNYPEAIELQASGGTKTTTVANHG